MLNWHSPKFMQKYLKELRLKHLIYLWMRSNIIMEFLGELYYDRTTNTIATYEIINPDNELSDIYVATSKKSNASYLAINNALEDVSTKDTGTIPMHIRNAPIEEMRKLGYNEGYLYPHDFPGHWVEQQYLPDKMLGTKYYIKDENIPE